jgi:hypothetical protein
MMFLRAQQSPNGWFYPFVRNCFGAIALTTTRNLKKNILDRFLLNFDEIMSAFFVYNSRKVKAAFWGGH